VTLAKVVGIVLAETTEDALGLVLLYTGTLVDDAAATEELAAAARLDEATAAAPQLAGSMPSGQQTPFDRQKEPLGQDQDAEQHFWPASGL
jgi:hypothetical protein